MRFPNLRQRPKSRRLHQQLLTHPDWNIVPGLIPSHFFQLITHYTSHREQSHQKRSSYLTQSQVGPSCLRLPPKESWPVAPYCLPSVLLLLWACAFTPE